MSQRQTTLRHALIINKLRAHKRASFTDICDYLERESDIRGEDLTISKRTFCRDMIEIGEIYGIYIRYDFSARNYYIEEEFDAAIDNRRLEALDIYNALKIKERQSEHIFLDHRQASGTEHLYDLLQAINKCLQIVFDYQTYYDDEAMERIVHPLAIKEFKYRWYLFAQNAQNEKIKCYALDRISNLKIQATPFVPRAGFNLADHLNYCFGIISPNAERPSEVVLSFEPFQGKYIQSLPLHHTQKILIDNDEELRVSLTVYLTHDFLMELLSLGDTFKVIKPTKLIHELRAVYQNALKKY
ncbi:MAG: WYL domain-containing protein [Odoribacteraceae bacterium]|jgi:predicted DNA-binding transcriptional regulator YafY|nr:WYL domain-containing protein [Odoribacteraceae bacterium]